MSGPCVVSRDTSWAPGRKLEHPRGLSCICGSTWATLSQSGHTIRCDGCRTTEMVVHTGEGIDADVAVAGYRYRPEEARP